MQYLDSAVESQNPANDGKRLALTPGVLGQPLDDGIGSPRDIRVGGGVRYTDPVFINAANTIVDAALRRRRRAGRGAGRPALTLRLNVYNLTDRVYIRNINNNAGRYNPGTPRSFLLSTAVRF